MISGGSEDMNRTKAFAWTSVVVVLGLFAMACPKKPKPEIHPPQATMPTETVPPVAATVPQTTTVDQRDFVATDTAPPVSSSQLPTDIEDANRVARERGLIRDAFFDYNEAGLSADAQAALSASATWLKGDTGKGYSLLVEGHCDERGTEQYNLALGDKRANTVKEYLVTLGVDGSRIRTVSYGEERPFDPGHDDSAWQHNRRGHLVLVGK
jgi:peptidoglycan-associated lipoprotein